jgi:hypothetical protein
MWAMVARSPLAQRKRDSAKATSSARRNAQVWYEPKASPFQAAVAVITGAAFELKCRTCGSFMSGLPPLVSARVIHTPSSCPSPVC